MSNLYNTDQQQQQYLYRGGRGRYDDDYDIGNNDYTVGINASYTSGRAGSSNSTMLISNRIISNSPQQQRLLNRGSERYDNDNNVDHSYNKTPTVVSNSSSSASSGGIFDGGNVYRTTNDYRKEQLQQRHYSNRELMNTNTNPLDNVGIFVNDTIDNNPNHYYQQQQQQQQQRTNPMDNVGVYNDNDINLLNSYYEQDQQPMYQEKDEEEIEREIFNDDYTGTSSSSPTTKYREQQQYDTGELKPYKRDADKAAASYSKKMDHRNQSKTSEIKPYMREAEVARVELERKQQQQHGSNKKRIFSKKSYEEDGEEKHEEDNFSFVIDTDDANDNFYTKKVSPTSTLSASPSQKYKQNKKNKKGKDDLSTAVSNTWFGLSVFIALIIVIIGAATLPGIIKKMKNSSNTANNNHSSAINNNTIDLNNGEGGGVNLGDNNNDVTTITWMPSSTPTGKVIIVMPTATASDDNTTSSNGYNNIIIPNPTALPKEVEEDTFSPVASIIDNTDNDDLVDENSTAFVHPATAPAEFPTFSNPDEEETLMPVAAIMGVPTPNSPEEEGEEVLSLSPSKSLIATNLNDGNIAEDDKTLPPGQDGDEEVEEVPTQLSSSSTPSDGAANTTSEKEVEDEMPFPSPSTIPSSLTSREPSNKPSFHPTNLPSFNPTFQPSFIPTLAPTVHPTISPSLVQPSMLPSLETSIVVVKTSMIPSPAPSEIQEIIIQPIDDKGEGDKEGGADEEIGIVEDDDVDETYAIKANGKKENSSNKKAKKKKNNSKGNESNSDLPVISFAPSITPSDIFQSFSSKPSGVIIQDSNDVEGGEDNDVEEEDDEDEFYAVDKKNYGSSSKKSKKKKKKYGSSSKKSKKKKKYGSSSKKSKKKEDKSTSSKNPIIILQDDNDGEGGGGGEREEDDDNEENEDDTYAIGKTKKLSSKKSEKNQKEESDNSGISPSMAHQDNHDEEEDDDDKGEDGDYTYAAGKKNKYSSSKKSKKKGEFGPSNGPSMMYQDDNDEEEEDDDSKGEDGDYSYAAGKKKKYSSSKKSKKKGESGSSSSKKSKKNIYGSVYTSSYSTKKKKNSSSKKRYAVNNYLRIISRETSDFLTEYENQEFYVVQINESYWSDTNEINHNRMLLSDDAEISYLKKEILPSIMGAQIVMEFEFKNENDQFKHGKKEGIILRYNTANDYREQIQLEYTYHGDKSLTEGTTKNVAQQTRRYFASLNRNDVSKELIQSPMPNLPYPPTDDDPSFLFYHELDTRNSNVDTATYAKRSSLMANIGIRTAAWLDVHHEEITIIGTATSPPIITTHNVNQILIDIIPSTKSYHQLIRQPEWNALLVEEEASSRKRVSIKTEYAKPISATNLYYYYNDEQKDG